MLSYFLVSAFSYLQSRFRYRLTFTFVFSFVSSKFSDSRTFSAVDKNFNYFLVQQYSISKYFFFFFNELSFFFNMSEYHPSKFLVQNSSKQHHLRSSTSTTIKLHTMKEHQIKIFSNQSLNQSPRSIQTDQIKICSTWSFKSWICVFNCDPGLEVIEQAITGLETPHYLPKAAFDFT